MSIGQRLKEERKALNMNQTEFSSLAGTTKQTLFSWETGKTAPDAVELAAFAASGVDVLYVLTGERKKPALNREQDIHWITVSNEKTTSAVAAAKVVGYDRKDGRVLLLASISNDPDVELCIAGDGEATAIRNGEVYVSTAWLAGNYPKTKELCSMVENKITESASKAAIDPKAEALLNNYMHLSDKDKDALSRLADSLAQSVISAANESA